MGRTACTEPQCLYKGALYLYLWLWKSRAIPLLPLWAVRPVHSLSACTRVHFTFTFGYERVELYLYSPYGPYGLYIASVPVQGWPLPFHLHLSGRLHRHQGVFSFVLAKVTKSLELLKLRRAVDRCVIRYISVNKRGSWLVAAHTVWTVLCWCFLYAGRIQDKRYINIGLPHCIRSH